MVSKTFTRLRTRGDEIERKEKNVKDKSYGYNKTLILRVRELFSGSSPGTEIRSLPLACAGLLFTFLLETIVAICNSR